MVSKDEVVRLFQKQRKKNKVLTEDKRFNCVNIANLSLNYPEFVEVICGLTALRYPLEFMPLSERVNLFITRELAHVHRLINEAM